jgi:ferric-dicitrate binding protein FerR (iron transport regulator)
LSDGSVVWTNADTKLGYSKERGAAGRSVVVEGEAYFEVTTAYDRLGNKLPFWVIIAKNGMEQARVEVTGTEFNISAYPEEATIGVTLLKGKVLLQPANKTQATSLLPGQTAELDKDGAVQLGEADTAQITGWKNHKFIFDKKGIRTIMRMIERWYDVPVQFDTRTEISVAFTGTLSSDAPVSALLHYMELTGNVHFTMKGDTIVVHNPQP